MSEFIKVPEWIENKENIVSTYLKKYIDKSVDGKISVDLLRETYKMEQEFFFNAVNEFYLRGFEFYLKKSSGILPYKKYENVTYIKVNVNKDRFENLNFDLMGIPNFLVEFSVDSDLFFNFIPLEGFIHFNSSLKQRYLEEEFLRCGYILVKSQCGSTLECIEKEGKKEIDKEFENCGIEALGLSVRSFNALKKNGINDLLTLMNKSHEEIENIKNLGSVSIKEILGKMKQAEEGELVIKEVLDMEKSIAEIDFDMLEMDDYSIEELNLSNRAKNAMENANIKGLKGLSKLTYKELFSLPSLGKKSIDEIVEKLNKWKECNICIGDSEIGTINLENLDYEECCEISLKKLDYDFIDTLISNGFKRFKDLDGKEIEVFENINIPLYQINKLVNKFKSIKLPKRIFQDYKFDERIEHMAHLRYEKGLTLEEVGEIHEVTRERVRQLVAKGERHFNEWLKANAFESNLSLVTEGQNILFRSELVSHVGDKPLFIRLLEQKNCDVVEFYEPLELFFFENHKEFKMELDQCMSVLPMYFDIEDIVDELLNILKKYDVDLEDNTLLDKLMFSFGYSKYGSVYSKIKLNQKMVANLLAREYLDEPMSLYEDGYEKLKLEARKFLNYELPENARSFEGRIRNSEEILLIAPKTFEHISKVDFDGETLEAINKVLKGISDRQSSVDREFLFDALIAEYPEYEFLGGYTVYSLVKQFYSDQYTFNSGNTMTIYFDESLSKKTNSDVLVDYIKEKGDRAKYQDIVKDLGWSETKLMNTITNYPHFVNLGNQIVKYINEFKFDDETFKTIRQLIEMDLADGIVSVHKLYNNMRYSVKLNEILTEYDIETPLNLMNVLKVNYKDLTGHSSLLFKRTSQCRSLMDYIEMRYETIEKNELFDFITKELHHSEGLYYTILSKLLASGKFIEISEDEIVNSKNLNIGDNVLIAVKNYLDENLGGNEYIVLDNLLRKTYRKILPKIEYRWTIYLIRYVATLVGYRELNREVRDYRRDKQIILAPSSDISRLDELVYFIINDGYTGNMHETNIYDYLSGLGIFYDKDEVSNKVLPSEIKKSPLFKMDEVGRIALKEKK